MKISLRQARLLRMKSQRLGLRENLEPASPYQVLKEIGGAQAQDLPAALLSVHARGDGFSSDDVERARNQRPLQAKDGLVRGWSMRGTLHLHAVDDALWLTPLFAPGCIRSDRGRFRGLGWDDQRYAAGIDLLRGGMVKDEYLDRAQIRSLFAANGLPFAGQAPVHFLFRALYEGILCPGPDRNKKQTFALYETWAGKVKELPREAALHDLALRYLSAYGPAAPEDLAAWSGLGLGEARAAWALLSGQAVELDVDGRPAWMLEENLHWLKNLETAAPVVRLLPRFDTLWMGYASRDLHIAPQDSRNFLIHGGVINAMLLVDGEARAVWRTRETGKAVRIILEPFAPLPAEIIRQAGAEAQRMGQFLGKTVILGNEG